MRDSAKQYKIAGQSTTRNIFSLHAKEKKTCTTLRKIVKFGARKPTARKNGRFPEATSAP